MAKLTVTTFLSVDGVMQAPGGPHEDPSGSFRHGGWLPPYADEDMGTYVDQWFRQAGSFLLGRRTYDIFAAHWPLVTDPADTVATGLNTLPKYVASRTMQRADWAGTTVLHDVPGEVAKLKEQPGGEIQVHGSGELIRSLMAHDLVDEYRLWIYPVVLGSGMRLFGDTEDAAALKLVDTKITSTGVAIHVYQPAGKATYGSFALE